eukprot:gb/GEZN01001468.1/.p1 GENE.gb/GEZN01001468.1/~~gb/GEZN01001468.1/.p1  ORF type:complete len:743 (-),score=113.68 gb/GEZN01001468.1/:734-2962(-)
MSLDPSQRRVLEAVCEAFLPKLTDHQVKEVVTSDAEYWNARGHPVSSERRAQVVALCQRNAESLHVAKHVEDTLMTRIPADQRKQLLQVLSALDSSVGMAVIAQTGQSFADLSLVERQQVLVGFNQSVFATKRLVFRSLKQLILSKFLALPGELPRQAWAAVGYDGPKSAEEVSELVTQCGPAYQEYFFKMDNRDLLQDTQLQVDVLIVGSGCGGGVIAAGLAVPGRRVLVLEKGRYFKRAEMDGTEAQALKDMYENAGALSTTDTGISVFAGATFGGGSAVNWACSLRTPSYVREEWSKEHGLHRLGPNSPVLTRALDKVSARLGVQLAQVHSKNNQLFIDGAKQCGLGVSVTGQNMKSVGMAGGAHAPGAGSINIGDRYGLKNSGAETYLQDAAKQGCSFMDQCYVERVLLEQTEGSPGRRAVGVEGTVVGKDGKTYKLVVRAGTVVVSCGALNSPALLLRSGLRNKNRLIGKNLRLHPAAPLVAFMPFPVKVWEGPPMTTVSDTAAAGTDGSHYGTKLECPIAQMGFLASLLPWRSPVDFLSKVLQAQNGFLTIVLARDKGCGQVTLDSEGRPAVSYPLSKHDRLQLIHGMSLLARVSTAVGAETLWTSLDPDVEPFSLPPCAPAHASAPVQEQTGLARQAAVEQFIQQLERKGVDTNARSMVFSAHQMGTCRMGSSPEDSVTKETGEVWECNGLYVADASVFPSGSGANPMLTTLALCFDFAERLNTDLSSRQTRAKL